MMRLIFFFGLLMLTNCVSAQSDTTLLRGSYAWFGEVQLEDNSFMLEEAFNQDMGVIQHIFNANFDKFRFETLQLSYTQEIPLTHRKHQLNLCFNYLMQGNTTGSLQANGFGDLYVSYRPLIFDERDWLMFIPRLTVIVPTGDASRKLGNGAWGLQVNLAATKRLSKKLVMHFNAGATQFVKFDRYQYNGDQSTLTAERDVLFKNLGWSAVWHFRPRLNLMFEHTANYNADISDQGVVFTKTMQVFNPALRYCINRSHMQVVPGIGFPVSVADGRAQQGIFFYLSFETSYR